MKALEIKFSCFRGKVVEKTDFGIRIRYVKMNFSEHRLTDWTWQELYRAQLGEDTYNDYFNSVWMALDRLQENEYYDIAKQVKTENRDLFIKICCQYVLTHKEYELSNDYTKIIRRQCFILTENTGQRQKKIS